MRIVFLGLVMAAVAIAVSATTDDKRRASRRVVARKAEPGRTPLLKEEFSEHSAVAISPRMRATIDAQVPRSTYIRPMYSHVSDDEEESDDKEEEEGKSPSADDKKPSPKTSKENADKARAKDKQKKKAEQRKSSRHPTSRRNVGRHTKRDKKTAQKEAYVHGVTTADVVRQMHEKQAAKEAAEKAVTPTLAPTPVTKPTSPTTQRQRSRRKSRNGSRRHAKKSALKKAAEQRAKSPTDARRNHTNVMISSNVTQISAQRDELNNPILEEIKVDESTKRYVKSYIQVHYIKKDIFVAVECFVEIMMTAYRRGIIHDCFKVLEHNNEEIPVKKRNFVICSTDNGGLDLLGQSREDNIRTKIGLKMNALVIRQMNVARIHLENDIVSCFLRPKPPASALKTETASNSDDDGSSVPSDSTEGSEDEEETQINKGEWIYTADSYDEIIHDCLRSMRKPHRLDDVMRFREHEVIKIASNGRMTRVNKANVDEILMALTDSRIAFAKEWRITVEIKVNVDDNNEEPYVFDCILPLEILPRRDTIFEVCRKLPEFTARSSTTESYDLFVDTYAVAKTSFQIADGLANGSLVMRKITQSVIVKVNMAVRGRRQKPIHCKIIRGYTTPARLFSDHIADASLLERGYASYVALRDTNNKRITKLGELTPATLLYPKCVGRSDIILEIEQKLDVALRVEVTIGKGPEVVVLDAPDHVTFTDRRDFDTLLKEIQLGYVPTMAMKPPQVRIFVFIDDLEKGIRKREIYHFDDQLMRFCTDKNVCSEIVVKTTASQKSDIKNQPVKDSGEDTDSDIDYGVLSPLAKKNDLIV